VGPEGVPWPEDDSKSVGLARMQKDTIVWLLSQDAKKASLNDFRQNALSAENGPGSDVYIDLEPIGLSCATHDGACALLWAVVNNLDAIGQQQTILVCDGALYCRLARILYDNPHLAKRIVLKLGTFHLLMVLQTCVLKFMEGSQLLDLLVEAKIFTGVDQAGKALAGGHFKRATLAYDALHGVVMEQLFDLYENDLNTNIASTSDAEEKARLRATQSAIAVVRSAPWGRNPTNAAAFEQHPAVENVTSSFNEWMQHASSRVKQVNFLAKLCEGIELMQEYKAVTHCPAKYGGLESYIHLEVKTLPWLEAFNRLLYCRLLQCEIATLKSLDKTHPEVYSRFRSGKLLCVRRPVKDGEGRGGWSGVHPDQALEHG